MHRWVDSMHRLVVRSWSIGLIPGVMIALAGCGAAANSPPDAEEVPAHVGLPRPSMGRVVFDAYYINFAWGFTLQGTYVDSDGGIWRYERSGEPWMPKYTPDGWIPAADLDAKFANVTRIGTMDVAVLRERFALVERAANASLKRWNAGADMGADSLVAYLYDPQHAVYQEVTLRAHGDWEVRNESREARTLEKWLDDVMRQGAQ